MLTTYIPYADINLLKVYQSAAIEEAFFSIANEWGIEYGFPHGGCQQRAHIISLILQSRFGIDHYKVWLFAPAALNLKDSRMLHFKDATGLSPDNLMEWGFHVAPIIRMEQDGVVDSYVMDPSLSLLYPLRLQDWFNMLGNGDTGQYSFLTPDKYFFNSSYHTDEYGLLTMLFDGSFYNYENPAKDNLAVEKGLAINDMVSKIYESHLLPMMKSEDEEAVMLEDMKAVFGNATALDMLFSQNISGYTDNTTLRYVLTQYPSIIAEARTIFNDRLYHWVEVMNGLM